MGINMSYMGMRLLKGVSMSQLLGFVTDRLLDQLLAKDIKDFDGFHLAILDTFNAINMALPGKHYDPPSLKDVTDLFDEWKKKDNNEERKKVFTEFMQKNLNTNQDMNKVDKSTVMTAIVVPPAAMVAKRTGQTLPQLKLMKAVPDILFVPSATVLALIAVKIIRYKFKGKTTASSKDDATTPHDRDQHQTARGSAAKPLPAAPAGEEHPKHAQAHHQQKSTQKTAPESAAQPLPAGEEKPKQAPAHDQQEPIRKTAPKSAAKPLPAAPAGEEQPKHAPPNFYCALCDRFH